MKNFFSTIAFVALFAALGFAAYTAIPREEEIDTTTEESQPLDMVSEFSKIAGAAPESTGTYNAISLALDNGVTSASELITNYNANSSSTAVRAVTWDTTFGFIVYDPTDNESTDFAIEVGDPVFIQIQGSNNQEVYSIVGDVPPQGSVKFDLTGTPGNCTYNFISVPLDRDHITNASELVTDVEQVVGANTVDVAVAWDTTFGFVVYDPADNESTNFDVQVGHPYFVCTTTSDTWPSSS